VAYTIQIDEEQRDLIEHALNSLSDPKEHAEVEVLAELFCNLPEAEERFPGVTHSFIL